MPIHIDFIPKTKSALIHYEEIMVGLRNPRPMLERLALGILKLIYDNFYSEGRVFDNGWQPLAPSTLQKKPEVIYKYHTRKLPTIMPWGAKTRIKEALKEYKSRGYRVVGYSITTAPRKRILMNTGKLMQSWDIQYPSDTAVRLINTATNKYGEYYGEYHQQNYGVYTTRSGKPYPRRKIIPDIREGTHPILEREIEECMDNYLKSLGIWRPYKRIRIQYRWAKPWLDLRAEYPLPGD